MNDSANKNELISQIYKTYSINLIYAFYFSNLPNQVVAIIWTKNTSDLKQIWEKFEIEDSIKSVLTNILYSGGIYETWRDEHLRKRATL